MEQATSSFELIERIRGGDREALSPLFEKHRSRLAVLIHYQVGAALRGSVEVDDLVQETFLRAFEDFDRFHYRGPGSFLRWLSSIAGHAVVDAARLGARQKRDGGRRVPLRSESNPAGADPSDSRTPSRLLRGHEGVRRLMALLDALPEHHRQAILLAKFEGLDTAEMAEKLGKSRAETALLLHRALKRLRELDSESAEP